MSSKLKTEWLPLDIVACYLETLHVLGLCIHRHIGSTDCGGTEKTVVE